MDYLQKIIGLFAKNNGDYLRRIMGIICEEYLGYNLDRPIPAGRDDIFVVEVDDVHSRSVADENPPKVDLRRAHHVPDLA